MKINRNILYIIVMFVLLLIITEISFVIFYPQPIDRYQGFPEQYDKDLGWIPIPNIHFKYVRHHHYIVESYNYQSIRANKDYNLIKEHKRILVLGDSQIAGLGLKDDETFPAQLQKVLGNNYEVINMGVSGYSTDQELLYLLRDGLRFKPDIVIVGFSQNDVMGNMFSGVNNDPARGKKPMFKLTEKGLVLIPTGKQNPPLGYSHTFCGRFHSCVFFRDIFSNLNMESQLKKDFWSSYHDSEMTQAKQYNEQLEYAFTLLTVLFDNFNYAAKQNNFTLIIMNVPTNTQDNDMLRSEYFNNYNVNINDFAPNVLNNRIKSYTEIRNIAYVDLLPHFKSEYHQYRDIHWNKLGTEKAAEIVAEII